MKKCTRCGVEKDPSEFYKGRRICKVCCNNATKEEYYKKHPGSKGRKPGAKSGYRIKDHVEEKTASWLRITPYY